MPMENQPSQPNRPKSQIYLQRAAEQAESSTSGRGAPLPQNTLPALRPALPVLRSSATQRCPHCGAVQPASTSVCMACGAFIQSKTPKKIRCRRCGTRASANLVLCPGCGRELQAAPPRIGLFLASLIVVALFLVLLTRASNFQPLTWTQASAAAGWRWISAWGDRLDPQISINTIPVTPLAEGAATNGGLFGLNAANNGVAMSDGPGTADAAAAVGATTLITTAGALNNPAPVIGENSNITGTGAIAIEPAVTVAVTVAATVAVTTPPTAVVPPVATATATAVPSATPEPTATLVPATATATATPAPQTPTSEGPRAAATVTAQARLSAGNGESGAQVIRLQPTATLAASATARPTVAPTLSPTPVPPTPVPPTASPTPALPTPTANVRTYAVRAGDTPYAIATQFDITVIELLSANGLALEDARRLRVGQELIIPTTDSEPTVTPTVAATATALPLTPTATATGASRTPTAVAATTPTTASVVRLDAPQLRSPEPNAFLSCNGENTLTWLPVAFMRESDQYRLHLGFLSGYNGDGTEQVTWVLEQLMPASASLWRMDEGLCGLAPQSTGRQWRWYVEVVEAADGGLRSVSQSSTIWGFSWN